MKYNVKLLRTFEVVHLTNGGQLTDVFPGERHSGMKLTLLENGGVEISYKGNLAFVGAANVKVADGLTPIFDSPVQVPVELKNVKSK